MARAVDSRAPAKPALGRFGWVALGFAAATLLCALVALAALNASTGDLAARVPLAPGDEQRAVRALATGRTPEALATAEKLTRRALEQAPAAASSWVRLAYIESERQGRLTPEAAVYLDRSYQVSPLGPDVSLARLRLVFEHWGEAPQTLRDNALRDLESASRRNVRNVRALADGIGDPSGRLALRMSIAQLELERAAAAP